MSKRIPVPTSEQRLRDITGFAMMGATNKELADFLQVSLATFERWLVRDDEDCARLREAVEEGKGLADARVARSLYQSAVGAKSWEEKAVNLGEAGVEVVKLEKQHPPNVAAASRWLAYRRGWVDRVDVTFNDSPDVRDMKEMLAEFARRHGTEAAKAVAQHHGYSGLLIEGSAVEVENGSD